MFKVLNLLTGEEILILEPRWLRSLPVLRRMDQQETLVCPGCRRPVRVRVPRYRRAHFAHKHLGNCAFGGASPELLGARAGLYDWLVTQFGGGVTVEKKVDLPELSLPRPIDGWVEGGGGSFAYWIVERRMPPEERHRLAEWALHSGSIVHFLFLQSMLHEEKDLPGGIYLTTTERFFLAPSEYDFSVDILPSSHPVPARSFEEFLARPTSAPAALHGSLHYLDGDAGRLTTFRGLRLEHAPQLFRGRKEQQPLALVTISPRTGEPVHPGEAALLRRVLREGEARSRVEAGRISRLDELQSKLAGRVSRQGGVPEPGDGAVDSRQLYAREATCIVCGEKTTDWVTFYGASKTCVCRKCSGK